MNIGDWVLAASGKYWYMSYIDSISRDSEIVHVTKITRFVQGVPENVQPAPATCSMRLIIPLDSSLRKEDYDELIDLAIKTEDRPWFLELREKMMANA